MAWFNNLQKIGLVYESPDLAEESSFKEWYNSNPKQSHYNGYWEPENDILEYSPITEEPVDEQPIQFSDSELMKRQRFAESTFNDKALNEKSHAAGAYQIMPITHQSYVKATGDQGDLFDYDYNKKVRDWYMNRLLQSKTITNGNPTDIVRLAKQYAAYNWGQGNLGNYLQKKKNEGVDIYQTLDWIEDLPKETRDYVKFIVLGEDVKDTSKTNANYNKNAGKYQQGGLVYSPFIQDYNASEKQNEDIFTTLPEQQPQFKVEPVKAYNPQQFQIQVQTPKEEIKKRGQTTFKKDGIDVGNMRELLDKFEEAGISVRVTSGVENRKTKSGKASKHSVSDAIDITPGVGETYESIREKIKANAELLAYMQDNGIGIIDETDPLMMIRTGATGKHWHISRGGERLAIHGFNKLFG